jgi:hypothetical protein
MRAIVKQALYLAAALIGIYAILLALSYALVPGVSETKGLDSSLAEDSIFTTDPKYVFLNRAAVRPAVGRIVFVGASNTAVGFKQQEVQQLVPSFEVDNLSVGGSNMTQVAQIVDLVQDLQAPAARRRTTYVIGIWYGMFVPDEFRWATPDRHKGDTDIDIERYRYGFYRRSDNGPRQILPSDKLSLGVMLIHPYLVFDDLSRAVSKGLRDRLKGKPPRRTDDERNASIVAEAERVAALKYWQEQMHSDGPIAEEQFLVLRDLIARILAQGSKAVLVDLPIPHWHAERSPFYAEYVDRKNTLLAGLKGRPGFGYLEMADKNDDLDFSDEVHPKPRVTPLWATQVAALLQGAQP